MRTNIAAAAVAAERDPEAELKTAAEMLLQRGRAFAGSLADPEFAVCGHICADAARSSR
jgi:hypothetical protein